MPKKTTRAGRKTNEQAPQNALPKGKNYLFIIGIDEYKHQPRLYNAVKDAKDILELLTKKYQFSKDSKFLFTLFNQEATQENIFTTLDKLSELMTEEDKLLIYYSGHGELKKNIGEGFWIPYDGNPKNPAGTYISFSILTKYIKAIKAFHTFIIADSCFSGALFTERGAVSDFRDRLESIPSRWLLTAGRDEVVADGQPGDNSPFADAVLWWLKNNKDPRLRVSDFCNLVIQNVGFNAKQTPRGEPMRDVGHRGGEFMFRLKKYADTIFEEKVIVQPEGTDRGGVDVVKPEEPIKEIPHKPTLQPMASLSELKKTLKKALANDLGEAFELFYNTIDDNSSVTNLLINLQGQYNGMKKQENMGLSEPNFANRTYNRIRVALQDTVDKLEEDDLKPDALKASGTPVVVNNGNDQQVKVTISELERKGLESQLNILLKKLNFFLQQQAVINDPSQRFTLDMQIEETQQKVDEIKAKLGI